MIDAYFGEEDASEGAVEVTAEENREKEGGGPAVDAVPTPSPGPQASDIDNKKQFRDAEAETSASDREPGESNQKGGLDERKKSRLPDSRLNAAMLVGLGPRSRKRTISRLRAAAAPQKAAIEGAFFLFAAEWFRRESVAPAAIAVRLVLVSICTRSLFF